MNFWTTAEVFNPVLCRLMARHKRGRVLTNEEIATRGQLRVGQVEALAWEDSWEDVTYGVMHSYLIGCGLDFEDRPRMKVAMDYLKRRPTFSYLKRDPLYETFYKPLIQRWLSL